ncbi:MAG: exopolysaccharide biosynthesis protein [Verrucomicrobia bacterium]|nr:exopolysaccharide biosynthesis protein [Verrucomicrobiota bacterium]
MTHSVAKTGMRLGAISAVADRLEKTLNQRGLTVSQLVFALEGKGHAAIMAVLSLPFCFPIQIPGLSTPFGVILIFSGLRIAFGQEPWLPGWLMVRDIPDGTAHGLLRGLRWIATPAEKVLHPRALPLPVPFSNLLAAVPILLISLALLEDDGVFLISGYLAAVPCVVFFGALFLYGPKAVMGLWTWISHFWA